MIEPVITALHDDFDRWEELHALIVKAFAYMDGVIDPPSSAKALTAASLRKKAANEQVFIAIAGGRLIGCIFADARADHIYVGKIAVDADWRKRGVNRALLTRVEEHARLTGKPALELQVRIELTGNQATFTRLGFVETARTAHAGFNRATSITMRKKLPA